MATMKWKMQFKKSECACAHLKVLPSVFLIWQRAALPLLCSISCCPLSHGGWRSGLSCFKNPHFKCFLVHHLSAQAVISTSKQWAGLLAFYYDFITVFGSLIDLKCLKPSGWWWFVNCPLEGSSVRPWGEYVGQVGCVADPWTDWLPLPNS